MNVKYPVTLEDAIILAEEVAESPRGLRVTMPTRTAAVQLRNKIYYLKKKFTRKFPDDDTDPLSILETHLEGCLLTLFVNNGANSELNIAPVEEEDDLSPEDCKMIYFKSLAVSNLGGPKVAKTLPASLETEVARLYASGLSEKAMRKHVAIHGSSFNLTQEVKPPVKTRASSKAKDRTPVPDPEDGVSFRFTNRISRQTRLVRYVVNPDWLDIESPYTEKPEGYHVQDVTDALYGVEGMDPPKFNPDYFFEHDGVSYIHLYGIGKEFSLGQNQGKKDEEGNSIGYANICLDFLDVTNGLFRRD